MDVFLAKLQREKPQIHRCVSRKVAKEGAIDSWISFSQSRQGRSHRFMDVFLAKSQREEAIDSRFCFSQRRKGRNHRFMDVFLAKLQREEATDSWMCFSQIGYAFNHLGNEQLNETVSKLTNCIKKGTDGVNSKKELM